MKSKLNAILIGLFDFLASLKLAVVVLLGLAFSLATATVLESLYDTPTGRYYVYGTFWFKLLLAALGLNIFCSAMSRWPWTKKHLPFLLAHVGILTLLFGSWITQTRGLDGNLRVEEGHSNAGVEMDRPVLVLTEGNKVKTIPVRWQPPGVKFSPISLSDSTMPYDLKVTDFISRADPVFDMVERPEHARVPGILARPALQITVAGGPMRISQEFWLWTGDPGWSSFQAGPAYFEFQDERNPKTLKPASQNPAVPAGGPHIAFTFRKDGGLSYEARSSQGKKTSGRFSAKDVIGQKIDPDWKTVTITVKKLIPDAWVQTTYQASRIQYGEMAPPSAIRVVAGDPEAAKSAKPEDAASVWLGIGSRAILRASGHEVEIGYFNERVILPFAVKLDHFQVDYYPGSTKAAAYSSDVTVPDGPKQKISMNHPLEFKGFTLYQASYEDGSPRPTVSIFSVNRDPGRWVKYIGSLLIVFGTIVLFGRKYWQNRKKSVRSAG